MDECLHSVLPSKEHIATFPRFQNLVPERILVINSLQQCEALRSELEQVTVFGFDSESKPTFKAGEVSTGPHLIQLATLDKAYLFQMHEQIWQFLKPIFASRDQIKVGFGLKNDAHLFRKRGIELNNVIELSTCFRDFGLKNPIGLKNAMALLFQVNFPKSKHISTSNWATKHLSPAQISYATADAYAPRLVFEELLARGLLPKDLPSTSLKPKIRPNSTI
ncbi:MAG TPA: 3'-5' exonuclease domain-containing protein 2 [Acinetobacter lwoffii]|uniref:3'-5' exonuclease n=1 Tax=Acinetobacter lwoffii TaxID=28090 RepID=A0A9D2UR68_ACILW|nr:3'-5' exonuclease [Acinetobacter sp. 10FS3-1]MDM1782027.1 3'-5' exonuclease domain-containing protein 2 [Acinetobacter indicus]QKQ68927.1 3'-5' exonuclease domain-containing protein 2 [Acinetobacter sp. 10FS3-1]HJF27218.1 3'-5' exonuclease domain-containing protein 2 [Acinetobacter lwoffii]